MAIVLWCLGGLLGLYLLASFLTAELACRRFPRAWDPMKGLTHATDALLAPYAEIIGEGRDWLLRHPHDEAEITSFDGLRLRASYYDNPAGRGLLVACHGYRSDGVRDFASALRFYHDHGLSILLIDQRASGRSEGRYITFGVRESRDVRDWCLWARERHPELPVVLAGLSMGASTVLMASDDLPENVRVLLADCGYDSPWDELAFVARHDLHPAAQVLLPGVDLFCRLLGGFGLRERSASDSLSRCRRPVFFVHGEADGFVPPECSAKNRAACAGPTALLSVPGAEHGISFLVDREGYLRALDDFLQTYFFRTV